MPASTPGSRFSPSSTVKTLASVTSLTEKKNQTETENHPVNEHIYRRARLWRARKHGGQIRRRKFAEKQYLPNLTRISKLLITNLNNNIKQYCLHRENNHKNLQVLRLKVLTGSDGWVPAMCTEGHIVSLCGALDKRVTPAAPTQTLGKAKSRVSNKVTSWSLLEESKPGRREEAKDVLETGIDEGDRCLTAPWHSGLDLREGDKTVENLRESRRIYI